MILYRNIFLVKFKLTHYPIFKSLYPVAGLISFTYIQQLYVGLKGRRLGLAQQLMAAIAQTAKSRGSTRVEWSTGHDNTAARALYEKLGATGTHKVHYVLEGKTLDQLAAANE